MEFKSLSNIHLAVGDDSDNRAPIADAYPSFYIDVSDAIKAGTIFKKVFLPQRKHPFSITVQAAEAKAGDEWLINLSLILCHPLYFRTNGPVLYICSANARAAEGTIKHLQEFLENQGIPRVIFVNANAKERKNSGDFAIYPGEMNAADFRDWYLQRLQESVSKLNIFVHPDQLPKATQLLEWREKTENELRVNEQLLHAHIVASQRKGERLQQYELLIEEMAEDINSKRTYIEFLLGKFKEGEDVDLNAIMQIKRFYHQEYELLPLWYKQFGHIIKVVTGKRTFRSLFNDRVKKYKN